MRRRLDIFLLVGSLAITLGCRKDQGALDPKPPAPTAETNIAPLRKEIIAQNILAAQLAAHYEVEGKNTFRTTELIEASPFLGQLHPRRASPHLCVPGARTDKPRRDNH